MVLQAIIIGFFTLLGPFVGIQTEKWLKRKRIVKQRKGEIFRTLLVSRQDPGSPECVKALNLLFLDFPDANNILTGAINDYFNHLHLHLQSSDMGDEAWSKLRKEKFNTLLKEVAINYDKSLKDRKFLDFDYRPQSEVDKETQEISIRKELCEILSNEKPLCIAVTSLPISSEVEP